MNQAAIGVDNDNFRFLLVPSPYLSLINEFLPIFFEINCEK